MKEITKHVYYCDHCTKHGLHKGHLQRHEKYCGHNPNNLHACFTCKHLEQVEVDVPIPYQVDWDMPTHKIITRFRCKVLDKFLHSYVAERKRLPERFPDSFSDSELMPKDCTSFTHDTIEL